MNTRVPSDSGPPEFWAIVNTLGQSVLLETLKMAAYYISHSNGNTRRHDFTVHMSEASSCYAYVQGTGLQILINRFSLAYDADQIRESFNYYIRRSA